MRFGDCSAAPVGSRKFVKIHPNLRKIIFKKGILFISCKNCEDFFFYFFFLYSFVVGFSHGLFCAHVYVCVWIWLQPQCLQLLLQCKDFCLNSYCRSNNMHREGNAEAMQTHGQMDKKFAFVLCKCFMKNTVVGGRDGNTSVFSATSSLHIVIFISRHLNKFWVSSDPF